MNVVDCDIVVFYNFDNGTDRPDFGLQILFQIHFEIGRWFGISLDGNYHHGRAGKQLVHYSHNLHMRNPEKYQICILNVYLLLKRKS